MKMQQNLLSLVAASLLSSTVLAQDIKLPCDDVVDKALAETAPAEVKSITAFTPAKTLTRVDPKYPVSAARKGHEGWVKMSYVIDEQGNVQDPIVEDHGGNKAFKQKALTALKKWTFEPAMKDGKPTQQCHQGVQFDFTMGGQTGASRQFISLYRDFQEFIGSGDIQAAETILERMHARTNTNRYENAWLYSADARLASELDDPKRELKSLGRALASSNSHSVKENSFKPAFIAYVHQRKFILNASFAYYARALESAEKLENMEGGEERYEQIKDSIEIVRNHITSKENIFVSISLEDDEQHFHTLARNKFAFVDIEGELETVEVRCESHREKFTVAESYIWNIPDAWGQCRVLMEGQKGTAFSLVEVAQS